MESCGSSMKYITATRGSVLDDFVVAGCRSRKYTSDQITTAVTAAAAARDIDRRQCLRCTGLGERSVRSGSDDGACTMFPRNDSRSAMTVRASVYRSAASL